MHIVVFLYSFHSNVALKLQHVPPAWLAQKTSAQGARLFWRGLINMFQKVTLTLKDCQIIKSRLRSIFCARFIARCEMPLERFCKLYREFYPSNFFLDGKLVKCHMERDHMCFNFRHSRLRSRRRELAGRAWGTRNKWLWGHNLIGEIFIKGNLN